MYHDVSCWISRRHRPIRSVLGHSKNEWLGTWRIDRDATRHMRRVTLLMPPIQKACDACWAVWWFLCTDCHRLHWDVSLHALFGAHLVHGVQGSEPSGPLTHPTVCAPFADGFFVDVIPRGHWWFHRAGWCDCNYSHCFNFTHMKTKNGQPRQSIMFHLGFQPRRSLTLPNIWPSNSHITPGTENYCP